MFSPTSFAHFLMFSSLMAVEFKQSLEQSLGQELPVTMAMDRPNVLAVVDYLLGDVLKLQDEPKEAAPALRESGAYEPIAIVGLSCRVPGAANAAAFWELLHAGVDAIRDLSCIRRLVCSVH